MLGVGRLEPRREPAVWDTHGSSLQGRLYHCCSMEDTVAEGWFIDPYGRHEQRWMSNGQATKLVRDGRVERTDEPPDVPPDVPLVRAPENGLASPKDVLRADDIGNQVVPKSTDIADVIYDRNMFFTSVPMGYQERLAGHGRRSRKGHLGFLRFDGHPPSGAQPRKGCSKWRLWNGRSPVLVGRSPRSSRLRSSSAVSAAIAASAKWPGTSTSVRRQCGRG